MHDRQRLVAGRAHPHEREHLGPRLEVERRSGPLVGAHLELDDLGARLSPFGLEVVEERGQARLAVHLAVGDPRAEAAAAHEQALVDHLLDRAAHRRPGEGEAGRDGHLVFEGIARLEASVVDGGGQLLGELVVERHRRLAVDDHLELLR